MDNRNEVGCIATLNVGINSCATHYSYSPFIAKKNPASLVKKEPGFYARMDSPCGRKSRILLDV